MSMSNSDARKRAVAHQPPWSQKPHAGSPDTCDQCADRVQVPRPLIEALRGACDDFGPEKGVGTSTIIRAARAVLDAAREVEHE